MSVSGRKASVRKMAGSSVQAASPSPLSNLHVSAHPLIRHKLAHMYNPDLSSQQFYRLMKEVGMLMAYEVTARLATKPIFTKPDEGKKPEPCGEVLAGRKPAIVPILRSGLALAEGMREIMPSVRTGHLGLLQNEDHEPVEYLIALPETEGRVFIVVDAIIATGNVAVRAAKILEDNQAAIENILFCVALATEEGVRKLLQSYPSMQIHTGALGRLDPETHNVVPGFGDVGNRLFFGARMG